MRTLIAYASKYGCTEKCAAALAEKITGTVELCNLKTAKMAGLAGYDRVIIGSPIYIGKPLKEVSTFCRENAGQLAGKKLGLFICGMQSGDVIATELKQAFPPELAAAAGAKEHFGGEFILGKMSFLDRTITRKIAKADRDQSNILTENIDRFARKMNEA